MLRRISKYNWLGLKISVPLGGEANQLFMLGTLLLFMMLTFETAQTALDHSFVHKSQDRDAGVR